MRRNKAKDPTATRRDEVEATVARLVQEVRSGALEKRRYFTADLDAPVNERPARSANGRVRRMARN